MSNYRDNESEVRRFTLGKLGILFLLLLLLLALGACRALTGGGGDEDGADTTTNSVSDASGSEAGADGEMAEDGSEGAPAGADSGAVTPPSVERAIISNEADQRTMMLGGSAMPNALLNILINDVLVGTTQADSQGSWDIEIPTPAPQAEAYDLVAQIVSPDGVPLASQRKPLVIPEQAADAGGGDAAAGEGEAAAEGGEGDAAAGEGEAAAEGGEGDAAASEGEDAAGGQGEASASAGTGADGQPTWTLPENLNDFYGGGIRVGGTATPNTQVEVLVDYNGTVTPNTVAVDENGFWAFFTFARDAGTYTITPQTPGTTGAEGFSVTIPDNIEYANPDQCWAGGVPQFGEDRGDTYVVAPCEYFSLVANRVGVSYARLLAANPQLTNINYLSPGDIINIPVRP